MAAPTSRVVAFEVAGGVTLSADEAGEARRGVVLLAHGGGQTRHAWSGAGLALAQRGFRTVSLDLRGHGESGWHPQGHYGTEHYAEDLIDVAAQLGARPHLIGASLGGISGLLAEAMIAPGTFASLTLVDIVPRTDPDGVAKIMGFMAANMEQGFASLEEAADSVAAYLPHRPRRPDPSGLAKNLRLGDDGRWRWHWDPKFVTGVRAPGSRSARFADELEARCRELALPVHLIRGRMSELVSREAALAFVESVPNASFTDVADAGHMVAGDRNDVFLAAVLAFLDKIA